MPADKHCELFLPTKWVKAVHIVYGLASHQSRWCYNLKTSAIFRFIFGPQTSSKLRQVDSIQEFLLVSSCFPGWSWFFFIFSRNRTSQTSDFKSDVSPICPIADRKCAPALLRCFEINFSYGLNAHFHFDPGTIFDVTNENKYNEPDILFGHLFWCFLLKELVSSWDLYGLPTCRPIVTDKIDKQKFVSFWKSTRERSFPV